MTVAPPITVRRAVADAHRREWANVLAATVRVTHDLDLAEECVQDAYVAALGAWGRDGVPANPGAWLVTAAKRKALDALRRDRVFRSKLHLLVEDEVPEASVTTVPSPVHDDRLRLIFMCCHPALGPEAQIALTLRLVCGVTTADVAKAFLVPEAAMAARITRAKKKIAAARIPFRVPGAAELPERLDAALTVIHLLFTTGHTAPSGDSLIREDLESRALDLARLLRELMPDEREVRGLLALLLVNHARRAARADAGGRLVLLEEQDRSAWDRAAIAEGHRLVVEALRGGSPGRFALQAAIAALHAMAPTYADTDWDQVLVLYDELLNVWPSPVVALNRTVAVAMVHGPAAALRDVEELEAGELLAGQTAGLLEPYLVHRHDRWVPGREKGAQYWEQGKLDAVLLKLAKAGFDPHIHAIGDRAVRVALNAYALLRRSGYTGTRPAIAHAELVDPADIPRRARHGGRRGGRARWRVRT